MRRLPFTIIIFFLAVISAAQSPHGKNFKMECGDCHTSESWKITKGNMNFDHEKTSFPLIGQHKNINCKMCHETLRFSGTAKQCFECHTDIHKNSVTKECSNCHTPQTWLVINISEVHQRSRFPLLGAHQNQDCSQCHYKYSDLDFEVTGVRCYDCHQKDYMSAKNPDHKASNFSKECEDCHSMTAMMWNTENFSHDFFPLKGGHNISNCYSCHKQGSFAGLSTECYSCHKNNFEQTTNPNHMSAKFSTNCLQCHTINGWQSASFDHSITGFELTGAHKTQSCESCHSTGYSSTSNECYSCHKSNFDSAKNPDHLSSKFPVTCAQCHTTTAWQPSTFDHSTTKFPLTGKHTSTDCGLCHQTGYTNISTECYSCHQKDFAGSQNPNHVAGNFPTACDQCHNTNAWSPAAFDHSQTKFPLTGKHVSVSCESCHQTGYTNTSAECYSCHQTNYTQTQNPNHIAAGFPTNCEECHTTSGWSPATFDHDGKYFPIYSGKHQGVWNACADCHNIQNNYQAFSCITCHEHNQQDTDSEHQGITGYVYTGTSCYSCHPTGSKEGAFNHSLTAFPLEGSHTNLSCDNCHKSGYSKIPTDCNSCHNSKYNSTVNPNHTSVGISTTCENCHNSVSWTPSTFSHTNTAFALAGKHQTATCESCHAGKTTGTTQQCIGCHQNAFDTSTNPSHKNVGISTECQTCHTPQGWSPSSFNHSNTAFVLTGAHLTAACESCHKGQTTGTSNLCYSCHKTNFDGVQDPNHVTGNFPTTCGQCHTTSGWIPATFDHSKTQFPLTGKHVSVQCSQCHSSGYTNTPVDCYSCHATTFNSTTNPNHVSSKFPVTCNDCHSTNGWIPATFDHSKTQFPLTGKHVSAACSQCHSAGYTNTPIDCYSCHAANFNNTTNPNHTAAHFPTTCADCHTTNGWTPATFDHDGKYFPIYSGTHRDKWNTCADCHTVPSNYTSFSCIDCHEHSNKSSVDSDHRGVANYSYQSSACYNCHPTGRNND